MVRSLEPRKLRFIAVAGPTGSGKSHLAMELARQLNGEIVSCDSVQVYRGFDIGTAKANASEQQEIPHHLIDVAEWFEDYDAASYARAARKAIDGIVSLGRIPIVCGGTGLYLRALLQQAWDSDLPKDPGLRQELQQEATSALYARLLLLDPRRAGQLHPNDRFRVTRALELVLLRGQPLEWTKRKHTAATEQPAEECFTIVLDPPRSLLHQKIAERSAAMLQRGLLAEVQGLFSRGVSRDCKPMRSIGYLQAGAHLAGELGEAELLPKLIAATRQYAKRQCTWYRRVHADLRLQQWQPSEVIDACRAALEADA